MSPQSISRPVGRSLCPRQESFFTTTHVVVRWLQSFVVAGDGRLPIGSPVRYRSVGRSTAERGNGGDDGLVASLVGARSPRRPDRRRTDREQPAGRTGGPLSAAA